MGMRDQRLVMVPYSRQQRPHLCRQHRVVQHMPGNALYVEHLLYIESTYSRTPAGRLPSLAVCWGRWGRTCPWVRTSGGRPASHLGCTPYLACSSAAQY